MSRSQPLRRSPSRAAFRLVLALLAGMLALPPLAGCAYHPGQDQIAFLRDGALVAINPDGSDARPLAGGSIVSFAWSPDHHQLVFRTAPGSDVADLLPTSTLAPPDAAGSLEVVSINGGRALQITPAANGIAWSDAWWDPQGNRLVYREEVAGTDPDANAAVYVVSQADQPVGIARKELQQAASIPALAPDGSRAAAIDGNGTLRLAAPGQSGQALAGGALVTLPGTSRPGRVLWQPGHDALLYATAQGGNTALVLRTIAGGGQRTVTSVPALLDAAFAPDGAHLLVRVPDAFQLWPVATGSAAPLFTVAESDPAALAWWSPSGRWLLIQDSAGWRLVNGATGAARTLVRYGSAAAPAIPAQAQWHPAAGSPWSPDGEHFVFVATSGTQWLGTTLPQPARGGLGLFVASVANGHPGARPTRIASGSDRAPAWSYADPVTTFLVAS